MSLSLTESEGVNMRYTSAEASKLLKKLEEEKSNCLNEERDRCIYNCALGEKQEDVKPEYDFSSTQGKLDEIEKSIRIVKHAINMFNTTTIVSEFNMTIDQMLIYIPQLTQKKDRLRRMQSTSPKKRNESMSLKNGVIDYVYTNYDIAEAKKSYEETAETLRKAQLALDKINSIECIEIDL